VNISDVSGLHIGQPLAVFSCSNNYSVVVVHLKDESFDKLGAYIERKGNGD